MIRKSLIGLISVASILIGCQPKNLQESALIYSVPNEVSKKYEEFLKKKYYEVSHTIAIQRCVKESEVIFRVYNNIGYGFESFFYDKSGKLLGEHYYSDEILDTNFPVNIENHKCNTIKKTLVKDVIA